MKPPPNWRVIVLVCWTVLVLVVSVRSIVQPRGGASLYYTYDTAGKHWLAGKDLYSFTFRIYAFRYSPLAAVAFAPLTFLPDRIAANLWRLCNTAVLLCGLLWWIRCVLPRKLNEFEEAVICIAVIPLAAISINNAQANSLLAGLLLCATAAAASRKWMQAGAFAAAAVLIKLYPMALGLLLVLMFPRKMTPGFLLSLLIGLALPFAFQSPSYVAHQYAQWYAYLKWDQRPFDPMGGAYVNFFLLLRVWHMPVSIEVFTIMEIAVGAIIAGICLAAQRMGMEQKRLLTMLSSLACCWMILWGPATESCTYVLIAPAFAWYGLCAWEDRFRSIGSKLVLAAIVLIIFTMIAGWFPFFSIVHALGIHPLAALFLFFGILAMEFRSVNFGPDKKGVPQS